MKFLETGQSDRFVEQDDQLNLQQVPLAPGPSKVDFQDNSQTFYSTLDKLLFKSPGEVIKTVLQTQGYIINLENLLSCLEQWRFIAHVKFTGRELSSPKTWFPAISFKLPNKTQVGDLLSQFYKEIENYEVRLAEFEGKSKKKSEEDTVEELRKEIEKLRDQNNTLHANVAELSEKLAQAKKSHADVSRALVSQNLLPDGIRLAKVREIQLNERQITLRSGRKTLTLPIAVLDSLPEIDDPCLVKTDDGQVKGAFFYANSGTPFAVRLAAVLHCKDDALKVRDDERRVWLLRAQNDTEREIMARMKRGKRILLHLVQDQILRFTECEVFAQNHFAAVVQEDIAVHQLRALRKVEKSQRR